MRFHHYLKVVVCAATITFLIGCQKEIKEKTLPDSVTNDALTTTTNCKPVGLGLLVNIPNQPQQWHNLMLKWYDGNGRLKNLKAVIDDFLPNLPNLAFTLDYGELSYANDFVYLKDVFGNKIILTVKLNSQGQPEATWFDGLFHGSPMKDTMYLYYSATGRLDSLKELYKIGTLPQDPLISLLYRAEYDINGNIIHLNGDQNIGRVNFYYDYTKTNPGLIPHYVVSIPLKLLEYMELFEFPHHNFLTSANSGPYIPGYPDDTYPVFAWHWTAPQTNASGQIYYYEDISGYPQNFIFYSAWNCGGLQNFSSPNPSQSEFMKKVAN